jgi:hypothetical protein
VLLGFEARPRAGGGNQLVTQKDLAPGHGEKAGADAERAIRDALVVLEQAKMLISA